MTSEEWDEQDANYIGLQLSQLRILLKKSVRGLQEAKARYEEAITLMDRNDKTLEIRRIALDKTLKANQRTSERLEQNMARLETQIKAAEDERATPTMRWINYLGIGGTLTGICAILDVTVSMGKTFFSHKSFKGFPMKSLNLLIPGACNGFIQLHTLANIAITETVGAIADGPINQELEGLKNLVDVNEKKNNKLEGSIEQTRTAKTTLSQLSGNLDEIVRFLEVEVAAIERWETSVKTVRGTLRLLTPEQLKEINEFQKEFIAQLGLLSAAAKPFTVLEG